MRRIDLVLLGPLLAIGAWVAIQAHDVHAGSAVRQSAAALAEPLPVRARAMPAAFVRTIDRTVLGGRIAAGDAGAAPPEVKSSREPAPMRDMDEIHRRLMENEAGTYIGDILLARDSNVARWPDRTSHPLRVWVQAAPSLAGWNPAYPGQVRDAFSTWEAAGAPVPFTFVVDSSAADVHVTWVDHFEEQISGKTMWARDDNWWIVDANIAIALHHNHGEPLDASAVRAIALHEIGHLLGLDHCADTTNIMTARVRVRDLSAADKATMRLIYALPPGSVKEGR